MSWISLHCGCLPLIIQTILDDYLYLFGHWKRYPKQHPNAYRQFLKGRFTTQNGIRKFSSISDDHAHEQNNTIVTVTGEPIGIFDSPIGPEIARTFENFEDSFNDEVKGNDETKHYQNTASFKKMFRKDFEVLKKEFSKVGNPYEDDSEQMYTIVPRNIMYESSSQLVYSERCLGQE